MSKIDLDAAIEETSELMKKEEPRFSVEAQSYAITPNPLAMKGGDTFQAPSVTSRVIRPIPLNPAEMARMLALGKEKFTAYEVMVNDLVTQARQLVVSDQNTHNQAVELGLRAKKLAKEIKERKEGYTKHASDFVKGLTSFTKPFTDACDQTERITKDKNRDWMAMKELERRKQEKILQDAQREVQKKVDAEAKEAGVETVQIQPAIVRQEEKVITRVQAGSAHLRAAKDFKILNLSEVPREYLEKAIANDPDKFLRPVIKQAMKENPEIEIPGIMIFDSTDIVYRT